MTYAEIVSKVIDSLRSNTKDGRMSRRYVLSVLKDNAKTLISQKLLDRTISDESNIFTDIECFEFEKEDIVKCPIIEFRRCKVLMKSKKKLPEMIYSRLGNSLKEVTSVDGEYELTIITLQQHRLNNKRGIVLKNETYIYVDSDNYAYIPDKEIYAVNLKLITMDTDVAKEVNGCKDCECEDVWDNEFTCPDKLVQPVFKETLQTLMTTYKQIRPDVNPNTIENA